MEDHCITHTYPVFPDSLILPGFGQCVEGVAYLHAKGVVHRDLKPTNIFVHGGVVKIGDLGLATRRAPDGPNDVALEAPSGSTDVGTFLYSSPEVATGRYSEKCDVYSLGIVLWEMLTMRRLFAGKTEFEILLKVRIECAVLVKDKRLSCT